MVPARTLYLILHFCGVIILSFDDNAITDTVMVGLNREMRLEGPVFGIGYIDVIKAKGKSEILNMLANPLMSIYLHQSLLSIVQTST